MYLRLKARWVHLREKLFLFEEIRHGPTKYRPDGLPIACLAGLPGSMPVDFGYPKFSSKK